MRTSFRQRSVVDAIRFEALEPRQLRAGDSPGPNEDVHLLLNDNNTVVAKVTPAQNQRVTLPEFKWLDGTSGHTLDPLSDQIDSATVDGYYMWPNTPGLGSFPGEEANEAGVRELARNVAASGQNLVVLDNEEWHFDIRYYSRSAVDKTIADMQEVIGWIRDERPQLKIGIYGYMSQSDDYGSTIWSVGSDRAAAGDPWYQGNLQNFAENLAGWQATSDYLQPLAASVDYVFPVLYTGGPDVDSWERIAKSTIEDSRRYGKPVIPFLWPYYHEAAGPTLGLTEIPTADWQRQLNLVRQYADSALIWNHQEIVGNEAWIAALVSTANPQASSQSSGAPVPQAHSLVSSSQRGNDSPFADLPIDGAKDDGFSLVV